MTNEEKVLEKDENRVAVFVVPLAKTLAIAESQSESSLTEDEVLKIRDSAQCALIDKDKLEAFKAAQGFTDINPLNVWCDWNRVKYEEFGAGALPHLSVSILTNRDRVANIRKVLKDANLNFEILPVNESLTADVLNARSKATASADGAQQERIRKHDALIRVKTEAFKSQSAAKTTWNFLQLIPSLIESGAIEIFSDSSYICHANSTWKAFASETALKNGASFPDMQNTVADSVSSHQLSADFWRAMVVAFVQSPIRIEDDFISCGMHLLGKPDFLMHVEDVRKAFGVTDAEAATDNAAREVMWNLAVYLLSTCKDGSFISGNTFSFTADSPRLRAIWQQCDVFPMDDVRFNYLGYWRLEPVK